MSRKKLPSGEGKVKISITISAKINKQLEEFTSNKSNYIESLLQKALKSNK